MITERAWHSVQDFTCQRLSYVLRHLTGSKVMHFSRYLKKVHKMHFVTQLFTLTPSDFQHRFCVFMACYCWNNSKKLMRSVPNVILSHPPIIVCKYKTKCNPVNKLKLFLDKLPCPFMRGIKDDFISIIIMYKMKFKTSKKKKMFC